MITTNYITLIKKYCKKNTFSCLVKREIYWKNSTVSSRSSKSVASKNFMFTKIYNILYYKNKQIVSIIYFWSNNWDILNVASCAISKTAVAGFKRQKQFVAWWHSRFIQKFGIKPGKWIIKCCHNMVKPSGQRLFFSFPDTKNVVF